MPLPDLDADGFLPTGIHAGTLAEVGDRYGQGSPLRRREFDLLRRVVEAALEYPTIKRVFIWGSFVTARREPQDLDYSLIVALDHPRTGIAIAYRRFLVPSEARQRYGVDTGYLLIADFPLEISVERVDFLCHTKTQRPCGIVEVALRGEVGVR
jgi:hypothetical protein